MHPKRAHHNPSGCIYTVVSVLEGGVDGDVRACFLDLEGGRGLKCFMYNTADATFHCCLFHSLYHLKKKCLICRGACVLFFFEVDVHLIKCQINCTMKDELVRQWL